MARTNERVYRTSRCLPFRTTIDGTVASIAPNVLAIAEPAESIESRIPTTVGLANRIIAVLQSVKGDTAALLVAPLLTG